MKDSIKNIIQANGKVSVSYKSEIDSWYGEIKIFSLFCEDINNYEYSVEGGVKRQSFNNIDDAVNYFCYNAYTSKNIGYIQSRLMDSGKLGKDEEEYDFEEPSNELKKIFKEEGTIVDKEAKLNGIEKPKKQLLTTEEAKKEIEQLIPEITIDTVSEKLSAFKYKYLNLDPYISVKAVYSILSENREYSSSCNIGYWTKENIEKRKLDVGCKNDLKFKTLRVDVKFDEEYEHYEINV